jgi:hypothetical protein
MKPFFVKHLQVFGSFLTSLLLVSSVLAQSGDREAANQLANQADITAARSRYVQTEDLSDGPSDGQAYAQLRRPSPRPSLPPRIGYPQRGYPAMWRGGSPKHAAIGALIGFGLGAALGAKFNTDHHGGAGVKAALLFGTFGALIGATAGNSFGPMHHRGVYRRRCPAEDELGSRPKAVRTEQTASVRPASPPPSTNAQDSTQASTTKGLFSEPKRNL